MSRRFLFPGLIILLAVFALGGCTSASSPEPRAPSPAGTAPGTSQPRDAYVLLSGGGTPLTNHYSQYLQARALADFLGREFPAEATWIFFGIGNREGAPPILADVHRETKIDGRLVQSWEPGILPRNRAATKENFLRALREEILPTVRGGGTLYLFVGDHGELAGKGDARESAITLWQMRRGRRGSWSTDDSEILGVAELRRVLATGLGAGRVVFAMTQCHSGGFHELGLARALTPPRAWFTAVPDWVAGRSAGVRLRVAGFTATDQASIAAGCDPDPDPERWLGYERFLAEALLGRDLMTGETKLHAAPSFASAHEAATLVDRTIDKPRATSEHYLDAWAKLIETRLTGTLAVTSAVRAAVENFQRAVDTGKISSPDPALRAHAAQFARFTQQLAEDLPAEKNLLLAGTRAQLDTALRDRGGRGGGGGPGRGGRRGALTELRRTWTETLRPAWKAAVASGNTGDVLPAAALEFERVLLKLEEDGRDFLLPRGSDENPLANELFWKSGYAEPATLDRAKAEAVARWAAGRRAGIVAWAKTSPDPAVRAAAEKIGPGTILTTEPPRPLSRKTAAERVLFYRRVLAAWSFLIELDHREALAELHALSELERTPLHVSATASELAR